MMDEGALGKEYADGDVICRQGEPGDRMYVIQSGHATVLREEGGSEVVIGKLTVGDIFGEMAIVERQPRSATVRANGAARVLTLDKRAFLRQVHADPSLAYRILQGMSHRIRRLSEELGRLKAHRPDELDERRLAPWIEPPLPDPEPLRFRHGAPEGARAGDVAPSGTRPPR